MPPVLSKVAVPAGEWPSSKRRKGLNALCDLAAWGYPDKEIIDAAEETWRSEAYSHYDVELCRVFDNHVDPPAPYQMWFKFSCKYQNPDHKPHYRARTKTGDGTTPLREGLERCEASWTATSSSTTKAETAMPPYSEAKHRAILALWSAHSHRSFESLTDKFHRMEIEYIRPGITLPSSPTISRDVKAVHAKYAPRIREYFQKLKGAVHLVIDGWTSPISESYLGLVVVWFDKLEIHRCILEFIRLTSSHTGEYLASQVASSIHRYAIDDKILAAAADNASNNLTMIRHLSQLIPQFFGERSYVRCLAHILNLMAKAFMLPFSHPSKRTKSVLGRNSTNASAITAVQEFIQAQQIDITGGNEELEAPGSAELDEAEFEHDVLVAQASVVKAIEQLYAQHKVAPTRLQLQSAQGIMPKVAGLARRVDESTALTVKFHEAISLFPALKESGRKALSRRVPTRWGSDRHALDDHIQLRQPVQWLTGQPDLKLQRLALKEDQWPLAEELNEALEVFEVPTVHFSAGRVPLVHETLPKLIELKETLETMRDSSDISPVTRVGAQAALNVFDKYMYNMSICEVYFISLVMCPDVKLNWLRKHYTHNSVKQIRETICARFNILYATAEDSKVGIVANKSDAKPSNRWLKPSVTATHGNRDTIEAYLDEDPISLVGHGGLLSYWSTMLESTPRVARFALNYLTAPATSVDAERAFSAGRLTINHLQHNMSSQTFEAKMALGSWYNTPLLPDIEEVAAVIAESM